MSLISLIAFLALAFFYQNCSQIEPIEDSKRELAAATRVKESGLFISKALSIPFLRSECGKAEDSTLEEAFFHHSDQALCVYATTSCESTSLEAMSFIRAHIEDCSSYQEVSSPEDLAELLEYKKAQDLGYKADPSDLCAMTYEVMLNSAQGLCSEALNSCEENHLKQQGFFPDRFKLCAKNF